MLYAPLSGIARRIASFVSPRRRYPAAARRAALETLESRTLLTAAINVVGNSVSIADGDSTISRADYTDFGPIGVKFLAVTRTFTIQNPGDAPLILTSIKSSNKRFAITDFPSFNIAAAGNDTFTITFDPKSAGNQKTVITIKTNDPSNPTFTFTIGGQGINTKVDLTNGLQTYVSQKGVGTVKTELGMHLVMNYTGFLLNGSVFDSSLLPGHTPFAFTLGAGAVIDGWDLGLQGMKIGEKRVLIIPGDLAYPNGTTGIPAGSTLIFEVQLLGIDGPTLVVKGDGHQIADGDTAPDSTDLTDFGNVGTSGYLEHFFTIEQDGNLGTLSSINGIQTIQLEGARANQFRVQQPFVDNNVTKFGIRFQPTVAGVSTATVVIRTNDPDHPEFRFLVQGNVGSPTPPVDLSGDFDTTLHLPTQIGAGDELTVPVRITNWGWATANGDIKITLRASADGTYDNADVLLGSLTTSINLIKHASTVLNIDGIIPPVGTLAIGTYKIVAKIEQVNPTDEVHVEDNFITHSNGGSTTLNVVATKPDLTLAFGSTTPSRPVYIPRDVIRIPVTVTNNGIRPTSSPFVVDVRKSANNTYDGSDDAIATLTFTDPIEPGASKTMMVEYIVPDTGVPSNFFFVGKADLNTQIDELNENNNTAASTSITAGLKFGYIGRGGSTPVKFFDTDGTLVTASLTSAGIGTITKDNDGYHIAIVGTSKNTVVNITANKTQTPGDDGRFITDTFTVGNPGSDLTSIKRLNAPLMDLTGDFKISGIADTIILGNFIGDSTADDVLTIGSPGFFTRKTLTVSLSAGDISDVSITSGIGFRSLTVDRWRNTNAVEDKITAPYITKINTTGDAGLAIAGDFGASLNLTSNHGLTTRKPTLTTLTITGSVTGGTWTFAGKAKTLTVKSNATNLTINGVSIGTLNINGNLTTSHIKLSQGVGSIAALSSFIVGGTVSGSDVYSAGNLTSLKFGTVQNSNFFAGVKNTITTLPLTSADFTSLIPAGLPRISHIKITGLANAPAAAVLINSSFAAGRIGSAILPVRQTPVVDSGSAISPFGFATRIGKVSTYNGPASAILFVGGKDSLIPT